MSEEYKGLTIRIGADTSGLAAALKSANGAIMATQKHLNALARAAKLDPTGLKLVGRQMETVGAKAEAVAQKVKLIETALSQAPKSLVAIANATADAELKARNATDAYAAAVRRIRELKNAVSERAGEADFDWGGIDGVDATIRKMKEFGASMEEIAHYRDVLVPDYFEKDEANSMAKRVLETRSYIEQLEAAKVELKALYAEEMRLASANPAAMQTREFVRLAEKIDDTDRAATMLTAQLERAERALQLDPASVGAAAAKMSALHDEVRLTVKRIELLDAQMKEIGRGGIDAAAAQMTDLADKTARAESRAASLEAELAQVNARLAKMRTAGIDETGAEFLRATADAQRFESEVREARAELEMLGRIGSFRKLGAEIDMARAKLAALGRELTTVPSRFSRIGGALQQLGWATYSTITPAITMAGYAAISAAESVDAAYRNMRKTVQGTEEQFESLKQAAIDYSRTHVTSADQLLEIQAMGGQLGVATSRLEAFSHTVSNLDIATNLEAEDAATQLGQLAGILDDMTQNDFARYGDALVRLGNNNATLEDKIQDVMLRIASMGTILGFSTPELLAWSTAIAATGQGAEAAGTAISNTMSDIESAVGAGGDKLAAFAKVAGMSADAFKAAWESDPSAAMQAFIEGLKGIEEAGGSADGTLQELGITGVRQKQAILGLMQTIDGLNSNLTMSNDAWNGVSDAWGDAGDAAREADRKAEGFSGAIQLLRNNAQALAVEFGESMAPTIETLGGAVEWLTGAYASLPGPVKDAINVLLLAAAAMGPVAVAGNAVFQAHESIKDALEEGRGAWRKQVDAAKAANIAMLSAASGTGELTRKQKLAASASAALSASLKTIGPAAAVAAVMVVGSVIADLAGQCMDAAKSVDDMGAALESIGAGASGLSDAAEASMSISDILKSAAESSKDLASSVGESWGSINSDIGVVENCLDVMERYGDATSLTSEEQTELVTAVNTLNGVMGTSYRVVDATNGTLNEGVDAIKAYADAWIEASESEAAQQSLIDVRKYIYEQEQYLDVLAEKYGETASSIQGVLKYIFTNPSFGAAVDMFELAKLTENLGIAREMESRLEEQVRNSTTADGLASEAKALVERADAMAENAAAIEEYAASNEAFAEMMESTGMTAEELGDRLHIAGMDFDEFCGQMEKLADSATDMFDRIDTESQISAQEAIDNLVYNAGIVAQYGDNMAVLMADAYGRAGSEGKRALLEKIQEAGPESAAKLAAEFANNPELFNEAGMRMEEAIRTSTEKSWWALLPGDELVASLNAYFRERGTAFCSSLSSGIREGSAEAATASADTANGVNAEIDKIVRHSIESGISAMNGLSASIDEKSGSAAKSALDAARKVEHPLASLSDSSWGWGYDMVSGMAGGIISAIGERLVPAISSAAATLKSYIHFTVPDVGPLADADTYMPDMLELFGEGIEENLPAFRSKVEQIPRAMAEVLASGSSPTAALAMDLSASGAMNPTVNVQVSPIVKVDGGSSYSIGGVTLNEGTPEADAVRTLTDFALRARMANRR